MKQHISVEQILELSASAREKWLNYLDACHMIRSGDKLNWDQWPTSVERVCNVSSIGQIIGFLDGHLPTNQGFKSVQWQADKELCDELWLTVRTILEQPSNLISLALTTLRAQGQDRLASAEMPRADAAPAR